MVNSANTIMRRVKAVPILLLIFVFVSAPLACAAMASMPPGCAHPCCPKPEPAHSDPCAKIGCISTLPVLQPESVVVAIELPVAALTGSYFGVEEWLPESVLSFAPWSLESGLFLMHHQFLV